MSDSLDESSTLTPHAVALPPALQSLGSERSALYEIPQARRDARKRGLAISEVVNDAGEIWTPERAMFQFESLKTSLADQDGKLRANAFKSGATYGKLVQTWVAMNQAANEIAASRQENPAMWSVYDARQSLVAGLNIGDKVIAPFPTPEIKVGSVMTIDRKFSKNWRLLDTDGSTLLVPPAGIRPYDAMALEAGPVALQPASLPPVAAAMVNAAIEAGASFRARVSDVRSGPVVDSVETSTSKQVSVSDPHKLTTTMGGSVQTIDLGKPAWEATHEDVIKAVDASGTYLGKPGGKYDPYQPWFASHVDAIREAQQAGRQLTDEVLYDRPSLIRSDLSDDERDIACDVMVDVYRDTKDFGKAVQAYREYGKRPAELPDGLRAATAQVEPAPIANLSPVEVAQLPLADKWTHLVQATAYDGGDQDLGQRSFRAFTSLVGSIDEKPMEVWNRWASFIGSTELATFEGDRLLRWMESNLLQEPWEQVALPGGKLGLEPSTGDARTDYWSRHQATFEHGEREWNKTQDRFERQVRDVEELGGDARVIATARAAISEMVKSVSANQRAIAAGVKSASEQVLLEKAQEEAQEAAKYKPVDSKLLGKKPAPSAISGWFTGTYQGNDVLTNGKIVDLVSEPHLAGWAKRLNPDRQDRKVGVDRIVPSSSGDRLPMIGMYDGKFGEAKGLVYLDHAEAPRGEELVALDITFVQYFTNKFKGIEFRRVAGSPIMVYRGDERVGLISAMNLTGKEIANPEIHQTVTGIKAMVEASREAARKSDLNKDSASKSTAPEHAGNAGKRLDPENKFYPLYNGPAVEQAPVDPSIIPLTMRLEDFAQSTNEFAALFANPEEYVRTELRVDQATLPTVPEVQAAGEGLWRLEPSAQATALLTAAQWSPLDDGLEVPCISIAEVTTANEAERGARYFNVKSNYTSRYDSKPIKYGSLIVGGERVERAYRDAGRVGGEDGLQAAFLEAQALWLELEASILTHDVWTDHAITQAEDPRVRQENSQRVILSLFDLSGEWGQPWADAGYNVIPIDIQDGLDVHKITAEYLYDEMGVEGDIYGVLAATPCTDFANSGARHFAEKDEDGRTEASKALVFATLALIEELRPNFWVLENPVGRIERLTGLPKARMSFEPSHFGNPYTKKTMLWGNFNADLPISPVPPLLGSKMHSKYGGKSLATKNARSETPVGFARAFFMANNYADLPLEKTLTAQYPLVSGSIIQAVKAGLSEQDIRALMDSTYENDDENAAREALILAVADKARNAANLSAPEAALPADSQRAFRDSQGLNALRAPIEDKDWFRLQDGQEWQARQGYSGRGWSLVRDGQLHPDARNLESQVDFMRAVIAVVEREPVAQTVVAGPGSRAPKVDDLQTYTTKEAKAHWNDASEGKRVVLLGRVDMRNSPIRSQSWDEMSPSDRKLVHIALNEEFYAPMWYINTRGAKVSLGPSLDVGKSQELIDFEEGNARWDAMNGSARHSALLRSGLGQEADEAKALPWGELAPALRASILLLLRTPDATPKPAVVAQSKPSMPSAGRNLRSAAYEKNPLLTFLATHGLYHDQAKPGSLKSEFSPDKAIMVSGYGPVFKKTGARLDALTQVAIEEGYLPLEGTEQQLYSLVQRAIAGQKISPFYAEGVAEEQFELEYAEYLQQQADAYAQGGFDPFTPLAEFGFDLDLAASAGYSELEDPIKLEVNALLAMAEDLGIGIDLIKERAQDETRDQSEQSLYESARSALKAAIAASPGSGFENSRSEGAAPDQDDLNFSADLLPESAPAMYTLTSPTREDVLQQQALQEAELQRLANGGVAPAAPKVTADQLDIFNTQASVFDVPPEPDAEYRYAMVYRPFDIGTAPKDGFVRTEERPARDTEHFDVARHGMVVYSRELSDAETKNFELALIPDAQQLAKVVDAVADEMRKYASQYVEMAQTEPTQFGGIVLERAKSVATGYPVSIGDSTKFTALVQARLVALTPAMAASVTPKADVVPVEQYIKVAADSIAELRKVDVYRVLVESNRSELRPAIAQYIKDNRPDLVREVDDVLAEAAADAVAPAVMASSQGSERMFTVIVEVPDSKPMVYPEQTGEKALANMAVLQSRGLKTVARTSANAITEDLTYAEMLSIYEVNQTVYTGQKLGDFWEIFGDDAKKAASILSLTLITRNNVPMVGWPYHAHAMMVETLAKAGVVFREGTPDGATLWPQDPLRTQSVVPQANSAANATTEDLTVEEVRNTEETAKPITPTDAGNFTSGQVVQDGEGKQYLAHSARYDYLNVFPIVDGKPVVHNESKVTFHLNPDTASGYPERRHDPVYSVAAQVELQQGSDLPPEAALRNALESGATFNERLAQGLHGGLVISGADVAAMPSLIEAVDGSLAVDSISNDLPLEAARKLLLELTNGTANLNALAGSGKVDQRVKLMSVLTGKDKVPQAQAGITAVRHEFYRRIGIDFDNQPAYRCENDFIEWADGTMGKSADQEGSKSVRAPAQYRSLDGLLAATERVLQSGVQSAGGQSRGMWLTNAEYMAVLLGDDKESVPALRKKYAITRRQDLKSEIGGDAVFGEELPKRAYAVGDNVPGVGEITDEVQTPHGKQFQIGGQWILERSVDPSRTDSFELGGDATGNPSGLQDVFSAPTESVEVNASTVSTEDAAAEPVNALSSEWDNITPTERARILDEEFGRGKTDAADRYKNRAWNSFNVGEQRTLSAILNARNEKIEQNQAENPAAAQWNALLEKDRMFLVRGVSSQETARAMRGDWSTLDAQTRQTATRLVENNATLVRALTSDVVSADEYPIAEVAKSYEHISHHPGDAAMIGRNAFMATVQSEYDLALPFAETDAQKAVLRGEVEALKQEYMRREASSMGVRGNTYSSKISGRGNLDSKGYQRKNTALDRAESKFSDWVNGIQGGVKDAVLSARNEDQLAAVQQAKDEKAGKRRESEKRHLAALVNFAKGDGSKFGSYPIARVTMDRDGYPSSVTVDANDLTDNKFDIARTLLGGDKGKLRALVDEIRAEATLAASVAQAGVVAPVADWAAAQEVLRLARAYAPQRLYPNETPVLTFIESGWNSVRTQFDLETKRAQLAKALGVEFESFRSPGSMSKQYRIVSAPDAVRNATLGDLAAWATEVEAAIEASVGPESDAGAPVATSIADDDFLADPETLDAEKIKSSYAHRSTSAAGKVEMERKWYVDAIQKAYDQLLPIARNPEQQAKLKDLLREFREEYRERRYTVFAAGANSYSVVSAGRSNFNQKNSDRSFFGLDRAEAGFSKWLEARPEAIKAALMGLRTEDERDQDAAKAEDVRVNKLVVPVVRDLAQVMAIDEGNSPMDRASFVNGAVRKVANLSEAGETVALQQVFAQIAKWDADHTKPLFTARSPIWQYKPADVLPEASVAAVEAPDAAIDGDLRGYAYALVKDGQIITSGSFPSRDYMAAEDKANVSYFKAEADAKGADLYIGGYPAQKEWTNPEGLILGMTWAELSARQQGKPVASVIQGTMPTNAVVAYVGQQPDLQASAAAAEAAKRTRPTSTIEFPNAIVGPSGAKLVAYTWQWKPFEYVDKTGEDRTGRMSDWDKAEESQDTGREIVHQFQVAQSGGDIKVVSAESALALLGYLDKSQAVTAQGAISAVKTLARNRMELAELESALAAFTRDKALVDQLELPPVTRVEGTAWWAMGDNQVQQTIRLFPAQKDGELLPERLQVLQEGWRANRMKERGWDWGSDYNLKNRIAETKVRIEKSQAKVDSIGKPVRPVVSGAMLKANFMMALDGVYVDGTNQEVPKNWSGVAIEGSNGRGGYFFVTKTDGHIVETLRLKADSFETAMDLAKEQGLDVSQSLFAPAEASAQAVDEPPQQTTAVEADKALWERLYEGTASVEEFKAGFENWVSKKDDIVSLLSEKKKDDLLKMLGGIMYSRYKSEKKADVAKAVWSEGVSAYTLWRGFSYGMGKDSMTNGVRAMVEKTDAAQLAEFAAKVKQSQEEAEVRVSKTLEAIQDPKTREDYNIWMRATMGDGKTFKEARLALTPEQRAHYDDLVATDTRGKRVAAKNEERTTVRVAGQVVEGEIIATKHTKKGHDLFVVQLSERVSKEDYDTLATGAKRIGGYYSSYRGAGAIPGFQFTSRAQAEAFVKLAEGDNTAAKEAAQANRDAFQDDRSQTAVERLTEMADRLEDQANSSLGQDRKQNTHRRAAQAARAESSANADKAMAVTMRNIAQSIDSGGAKYLDRVRQKVQVSMLQGFVLSAHYDEIREKNLSYEKYKDEPPTTETADYVEFPSFTAYRSNLAMLARELVTVDGTKLIGQRLLKVADDVSAAYLAFAEKNYSQVAIFSTKDGERAHFGTRDAAEAAIARSGYKGRAIAYQVKRGQHSVILSPSEAVERGVWKGDGDARLSLSNEFGAELVEKIGKAARRGSKVSVPWQLETAYDRSKALARMGIETPAEFRAALREFISVQERPAEPDKVKELQRAMIGRANDGMDFFPTAEGNADEMVATADIEPGMSTYEPHGGWGHIAERIRAAGVEPDVGELAMARRELLEAKGFRLVSSDFLDVQPETFFTFGDTFRAPDGSEGRMQAGAGLALGEVLLVRADGLATAHDRDDLVAVAKNPGSGYDRILMNPPFSDGRDIQHVMHAYSLLNPRGRVVSLMGESAFTNQSARAVAFRDWLDSMGASVEKLPEGSFMDPSLPVNTGANARMVVIDGPDFGKKLAPVQLLSSGTAVPTPVMANAVEDEQPVAEEVAAFGAVEPEVPAVQPVEAEPAMDPVTALEELGVEVADLALTGFEASSPEVQGEVVALLDTTPDPIVETTQGESNGRTEDSIAPSVGDSEPDSGQPAAQAGEAGAHAGVGSGVQGLADPVQDVQSAESDGVTEEKLVAAQALLDEAKTLADPMPYLAERLAEGMNPADPFHMHLLEISIQESRDYNRIMLAHAGDFAGLEFKNRSPGRTEKYAFALPDASRPGQWRVSYFDTNGFSHHEAYPTQEKAQQGLIVEGFVIEAEGDLDRLSQTQAWAIGTATSDLVYQLNTRKITHAEFLAKHKDLVDSYAVVKVNAAPQAVQAPVEASAVSTPAAVVDVPAPAVPHALIGGASYPLTTYKTNGGKILSGIWVPTRDIALNVTESTFQKRPFGWFIRERDFPEGALRMTASLDQAEPIEPAAPVVASVEPVAVEIASEVAGAAIASPVKGPVEDMPVAPPVANVPEAALPSASVLDEVKPALEPVVDQVVVPVTMDVQTATNEATLGSSADVEVQASVAPAGAAVVAENSPDGTQDAGAELTYNKRNRIKAGLKWNDLQDLDPALRVSETTKDKVYPKPDYQAMVDDGMPALVAHVVKQCYDAIAVQPSVRGAPTDEDLQVYIQAVNRYMDGVMQWANDKDLVRNWVGAMARRTGTMLSAMNGEQINVSSLMERPDKPLLEVVYGLQWRVHTNEINMIGTSKPLSALQPSTDEVRRALKDIDKGWPGKMEAWQKQGYRIVLGDGMTTRCYESGLRVREGQNPYVVVSLNVMDKGRSIGLLDERFEVDSKDHPVVLAYMANMLNEYKGKHLLLNRRSSLVGAFASHDLAVERAREVTKREKNANTIDEKGISVDMAERQGTQWREGDRDVTTEELIEVFGFKGVNFGNWMKGASNQAERQLHVNHLYDAFMDLSEVLQIPPRSMSLDGMLGVAVGAQGNGQAAAHFMPGLNEINITRTAGAGFVAHEWAHALDHFLARLAGKDRESAPYLTEHASAGLLQKRTHQVGGKFVTVDINRFGVGIRPEVIGALKDVVAAMNKRPMTADELREKESESLQKTRKNVESWIGALANDYKGRGMTDESAANLNRLFDRARKGDMGEGYVGQFTDLMEDIRKEFKKQTGNVPPVENVKGLQRCVQSLKFRLAEGNEPTTNEVPLTSTDFAKNADELDAEKGGKLYWSTTLEKFARSFDAFVSDALEANGRMNSYLSLTGCEGRSVPMGKDRAVITVAFSKLIALIQNQELLFDGAMNVERDAVFAQRVEALAKLENGAGVGYTFWRLANDALRDAGGIAKDVDWKAVEDVAIVQSIAANDQAPHTVSKVLCEVSPGMVSDVQQADLQKRIEQVVASLDSGLTSADSNKQRQSELDALQSKMDELRQGRLPENMPADEAAKLDVLIDAYNEIKSKSHDGQDAGYSA